MDADRLRLTGLEFHLLPADEAAGRFLRAFRQSRVDLRDFRAGAFTGVGYTETDLECVTGNDLQIGIRERG